MDQIKINGTITKTISDKTMLEENDIKKIDKPVDYCEIIRIRIQEIRNRLDRLKESKQYLRDKANSGKSKIEIPNKSQFHNDIAISPSQDNFKKENINQKQLNKNREQLRQPVQEYRWYIEPTKRLDIAYLMKHTKLNETTINKIRDYFKKGKTKIEVAEQLGYTYYLVKKCTRDIIIQKTISEELRQKIRNEYNNGKSKRKIIKELDISRYNVDKLTEDMPKKSNQNLKFSNEQIALIRQNVLNYKSKIKVARRLNLSYDTVRWYTRDMHFNHGLSDEEKEKIREYVKKGKTKIEVANQLGYTYYIVKECTKDIITHKTISKNLQQQIRDEYNKGFNKKQIAEKLRISYSSVQKYTKDIPKKPNMRQNRSKEQIEQIRQCVLKYNSKIETAKILGLSYNVVNWYTRDIHINHGISPEMKKKIRSEVKKSRTKMQVSRKLNIPPETVYQHTHDIMIRNPHEPGLSGNPLRFLQEIIQNGYARPSIINTIDNYKKIKSRFPNIIRVSIYGEVIYFMQEYPDIAMRVFLENVNKKIYSYQKLKQITDVFQGYMSKKEKRKYIEKRKNKYSKF